MKPKKLVRRVIFCLVALTMLVLSSTAVPQIQASVITYEKTGTIEEDFNNGKLKVLRDRIMDHIFNLLDIFEQHKIIFRRESSENIYELTSFLSKNRDILKKIPEKIADDDNLTLLINQLGEIAGQSNLENETASLGIVEVYLSFKTVKGIKEGLRRGLIIRAYNGVASGFKLAEAIQKDIKFSGWKNDPLLEIAKEYSIPVKA